MSSRQPDVNHHCAKLGQQQEAPVLDHLSGQKFGTIMADPPWQFTNKTGKVAPEHRRLNRYPTMPLYDIMSMPVAELAADPAHLYLWVPNALLPDGLAVMSAWGFTYKSNIIWQKIRKDGGPDGRGVGFYVRNVTEILLFGVCAARQPGRWLRGGLRSTSSPGPNRMATCSRRVSASTRASRTNNTQSSRRVRAALSSNFSRVVSGPAGPYGEIRQTRATRQVGRPMRSIPRSARQNE